MTPEPRQALLAMKELINAGWCKGWLETWDGDYCLIGAALEVAQSLGEPLGDGRQAITMLGYAPATNAALRMIEAEVGLRSHWGLVCWNDEPERTKEEVVDAIDRALIKASPRDLRGALLDVIRAKISPANTTPARAREEVPA